MSIGLILLVIAGILVLFGVAQRVLDRLRLTDRGALLFAALIIIGGLLPDIPLAPNLSVNIGGALVPLGLCAYLLVKADTGRERARALAASALTGVAIYYMGRLLPDEPEQAFMNYNVLYGLAGGLIAYVSGRSRRSAFIAGVLGALIADVWSAFEVWRGGLSQLLALGGAGAFDVVMIAGLTAVLLAELVGEAAERLSRGKWRDGSCVFEEGEFRERSRVK
ncbi:MAG: DUF1614 domain-containing protein [Clostridia bacterium]|nr:DUF1614 domain-containing protein [Clostridia bacterium]